MVLIWYDKFMSKKRTREQKIIARLRRQLSSRTPVHETKIFEPSITKVEEPLIEATAPKEIVYHETKKNLNKNILTFAYDPKLIKRDLVKTVVLSGFFLAAIFAIQRFAHL